MVQWFSKFLKISRNDFHVIPSEFVTNFFYQNRSDFPEVKTFDAAILSHPTHTQPIGLLFFENALLHSLPLACWFLTKNELTAAFCSTIKTSHQFYNLFSSSTHMLLPMRRMINFIETKRGGSWKGLFVN